MSEATEHRTESGPIESVFSDEDAGRVRELKERVLDLVKEYEEETGLNVRYIGFEHIDITNISTEDPPEELVVDSTVCIEERHDRRPEGTNQTIEYNL